jgi:hypothetical protein
MTTTFTFPPILDAISHLGSKILGEWNPTNLKQRQFLVSFYNENKQQILSQFNIVDRDELKSMFSIGTPDPVNKFLRDNGFNIQLTKCHDKFAMYIASILKIILCWEYTGNVTYLRRNDRTYSAVSMEEGCIGFNSHDHKFPIVSLSTKPPCRDTVYMTIATRPILRDLDLYLRIRSIDESLFGYREIDSIFPMVSLNTCEDLSWIEGMIKGRYFINEAKQQTKFDMDEKGARVESACAMDMTLCWSGNKPNKEKIVIDKPFWLWIRREGINVPIFAAYINEENWRSPQSISNQYISHPHQVYIPEYKNNHEEYKSNLYHNSYDSNVDYFNPDDDW